MIAYLERFVYSLTHPPYCGCSTGSWKVRQRLIKELDLSGYRVKQVPNPLRLYAYKQNEEFLIDVGMSKGEPISILPVKCVEGRLGTCNENSIYKEEVERLAKVSCLNS